jgi:hypothetical protein
MEYARRVRLRCGVLAFVTMFASSAIAADKASCAAAAEGAQRAMRDRKLLEAKNELAFCADKDCPDVVSTDCTKWLADVEEKIPTVTIDPQSSTGPLEDVHVTIDGAPIEWTRDQTMPLEIGTHVVRFTHDNYEPVERTLELVEGSREKLEPMLAKIAPPPPPPPPPAPREPIVVHSSNRALLGTTLATGGVSLIAFGVFAGFGIAGVSQEDTLRSTCAPFCSAQQVAPLSDKFNVANVSLAIGLVSLVATGVVFVAWIASHRTLTIPAPPLTAIAW